MSMMSNVARPSVAAGSRWRGGAKNDAASPRHRRYERT
jgi:hypothetical protein